MSASQPAVFNLQEFTDVGLSLVGGRLYTYAYGTTAQKNAFSDPQGLIPQTYTADGMGGQYIALDVRGELPAPMYLAPGPYDLVLRRQDGSTVWSRRAEGVDAGMLRLADSEGAGLVQSAAWYAGAILSFNPITLPDGATVVFAGRSNIFDGGGGSFTYHQTGSFTPDDGTVFALPIGGHLVRNGRSNTGFNGPLRPRWFGAKFDGVTDDGPAVRRAVLSIALVGTGTVAFGGDGTPGLCLISTKVIVPGGVHLDLEGCTITGSGVNTNTVIESGYLAGGAIITNIDTPLQSHNVLQMSVRNGTFQNCGIALNLQNCIDNCMYENLAFNNCSRNIWARSCFYAVFRNMMSRGTAAAEIKPAYFFDGNVNANNISSLSCVDRFLGYEFTGGVFGTLLYNINAESGTTGIRIYTDNAGLSIEGCYFEALTGACIDMSNPSTKECITIDNNYFHDCDTGVIANNVRSGRLGAGNKFLGVRRKMVINDNLSAPEVCIQDIQLSDGAPTYPVATAGYELGDRVLVRSREIVYSAGSGRSLAVNQRTVDSMTPIAMHFSGDQGFAPGNVPFCTVTKSTGNPFTVYVQTPIVFSAHAASLFSIRISDNVGNHIFDGRTFGTRVYLDANGGGLTVTATNAAGLLRLDFNGINHPAGEYGIEGIVRIP